MSKSLTATSQDSSSAPLFGIIPQVVITAVMWVLVFARTRIEAFVFAKTLKVAGKHGRSFVKDLASYWPDEMVGHVVLLAAIGITIVLVAEVVSRAVTNAPSFVAPAFFAVSIVFGLVACVYVSIHGAMPEISSAWKHHEYAEALIYAFVVLGLAAFAATRLLRHDKSGTFFTSFSLGLAALVGCGACTVAAVVAAKLGMLGTSALNLLAVLLLAIFLPSVVNAVLGGLRAMD